MYARTVARFRFLLSRVVSRKALDTFTARCVCVQLSQRRGTRYTSDEGEYSRAVTGKRRPSLSLSFKALSSGPDIDLHDSSARAIRPI